MGGTAGRGGRRREDVEGGELLEDVEDVEGDELLEDERGESL